MSIPAPAATVAVWAPAVRVAHWTLAGCVLGALLLYEGGPWHERLGYGALALALGRCVAGWASRTPQLRFARFVHGPAATAAYARQVLAGRAPRHLGHNPLGGWMIALLLGCALLAGGAGAVYATDAFWGDPRVYAAHQLAGWAFVLLVPLHVAGALHSGWRHREGLLRAMLTGRKPAPRPGDIDLDGRT